MPPGGARGRRARIAAGGAPIGQPFCPTFGASIALSVPDLAAQRAACHPLEAPMPFPPPEGRPVSGEDLHAAFMSAYQTTLLPPVAGACRLVHEPTCYGDEVVVTLDAEGLACAAHQGARVARLVNRLQREAADRRETLHVGEPRTHFRPARKVGPSCWDVTRPMLQWEIRVTDGGFPDVKMEDG